MNFKIALEQLIIMWNEDHPDELITLELAVYGACILAEEAQAQFTS